MSHTFLIDWHAMVWLRTEHGQRISLAEYRWLLDIMTRFGNKHVAAEQDAFERIGLCSVCGLERELVSSGMCGACDDEYGIWP